MLSVLTMRRLSGDDVWMYGGDDHQEGSLTERDPGER